MKWLIALIILALLVALVAITPVVLLFQRGTVSGVEALDRTRLLLGIASACVGFVVTLMIAALVIRACVIVQNSFLSSLLSSVGPTAGLDRTTRWVSLFSACAALAVFSDQGKTVLRSALDWLWAVLYSAPFRSGFQRSAGLPTDSSQPSAIVTWWLLGYVTDLSSLLTRTNWIAVGESLIILLLAWFAAAWAVSFIHSNSQSGTKGGSERLQKFAFFVILAIGGFLSLAALSAIPELSEPPTIPAQASVDALQRSLDEIQKACNFDTIDAGKLLASSPFGSEDKTAPFKHPNAGYDSGLKEFVSGGTVRRSQLIKTASDTPFHAQSQMTRHLNDALAAYTSAAPRVGNRETTEYFAYLKRWFSGVCLSMQNWVRVCRQQLEYADTMWSSWLIRARMAPKEGGVPAPQSWELGVMDRIEENCRGSPEVSQMPDREPLGSHLGVLSVVAGWLLRSESLPLATLIGMLGFGLFGAALSRYVLAPGRQDPRSAGMAFGDLTSILLRGVSAAVVVFLAAEGGIAVFSSAAAAARPNAYVLLLTCLVGAVYSEIVWAGFRRRLQEQLGTVQDKTEDTKAEGESTKGSGAKD